MEQKITKKRGYGLQIAYIILTTLCLPLNLLYLTLTGSIISEHAIETISEEAIGSAMTNLSAAYFLLSTSYVIALIILAILNIIQSFRACSTKEPFFCLNGMLILKYGMVVFFVVNFLSIGLMLLGISVGSLIASHGTLILATPVLLPFFLAVVFILAFFTWLIMLPGSFFAIQVLRFSYVEKKIGLAATFFHGLLQFCFLADVLDTMYLSVKKWGVGKKSSMIIGFVYILGIIAVIWTAQRIIITFQT